MFFCENIFARDIDYKSGAFGDDSHSQIKIKKSAKKIESPVNNFYQSKKFKPKKIKHKKFVSPTAKLSVGRPKKFYKTDNLKSVKSVNYNQIEDLYESEIYEPQIQLAYEDFDDIYYDGKYMGHYKIGKPYEIEDIIYHPQEYDDYEEIGVASWYGEKFDGKLTANGEIYNLYSMTAAHRTLPLPSIVKVTNMENGKKTIVRVNDRGPFAKNRIIDLSKRAAEMLEYKDKGVTIVKVELLTQETEKLHKKLKIK